MMGLGYLGYGGPSSTSSNLSPLAPPFTVDRSNAKPNSNQLSNFTEPPPYAVPFSSSLHNWQYPHSSASRPDLFSNCDAEIDSVRTTSLPSANDYCYLGSESINSPITQWAPPNPNATTVADPFSYLGAPKQYYPPYASQVVDDGTSLVGLNEANYDLLSTSGLVPFVGSSQADYTQGLSGLELTPSWGGFWNGLAEGKQNKRMEADGSFCLEETDVCGSLVYKDYTKQGAGAGAGEGLSKCEENPAISYRNYDDALGRENLAGSLSAGAVECLSKCEENPAISYRNYDDAFGRENIAGSLSKGHLDDKSFLVQNLGFIPLESSKASILGSGTISTESHLGTPSLESATFSYNCQKSYSPYEKRLQLFDSCINDCISVTKSSPTLIIRPPAFGTKPFPSDTVSSKSVDIGNVAVNSKDVGSHNPSIEKEPHLPPSSEGKDGWLDTNHLSFQIGRNDHHIFAASSSTKEELSNKLHTRNALDHAIKARFGAQVPDINVPHGSSLVVDCTKAFKPTANSSEFLDHHNPAEDSPCWKGSPASHVSPFETLEAMPSQHRMKKLEACNGLNLQGTLTFPPYYDSLKASSREVHETSVQYESLCTDNGMSLPTKRNSNANLPAKEHEAGDASRARSDNVELNRSEGVQFSNNVDKPIKNNDMLNGSKSDYNPIRFHTKELSPPEFIFTSKRKLDLRVGAVDAGISTSDASEDDCVPLHTVENVLCSPSSGKDAVKPHRRESSPKMNVQMLVNAMHNLSELLLFHCSNDACALKGKDYEALEHASSNIDVCLSKKVAHMTPIQESMFPRQGIYHILDEVPDLHMGPSADPITWTEGFGLPTVRPQVTNEIGATSHGQLDYQCMHEQKRKIDVYGKKFQKKLDFVSSRDDGDVTKYHNMVQDIKKALDENFQLEEKLQPQTLLYKNLWLEAEAELCSIGFRARLDRVKIEMENCKSDKTKENTTAIEKLPTSNVSPDLNITHTLTPDSNDIPRSKTSVQCSPISSPTNHVDDVEASVMARFHILKSQGDNSNHTNVGEKLLPEAVDVGFSSKRTHWPIVGNQSGNRSFDVAVGSRLQHHSGHINEDEVGSSLDDPQNETVKEFRLGFPDDPIIQPGRNNRLQSQLASGWYDNSSSDWEHVLKDDFAWQN